VNLDGVPTYWQGSEGRSVVNGSILRRVGCDSHVCSLCATWQLLGVRSLTVGVRGC
jgi:hypothetical protein